MLASAPAPRDMEVRIGRSQMPAASVLIAMALVSARSTTAAVAASR